MTSHISSLFLAYATVLCFCICSRLGRFIGPLDNSGNLNPVFDLQFPGGMLSLETSCCMQKEKMGKIHWSITIFIKYHFSSHSFGEKHMYDLGATWLGNTIPWGELYLPNNFRSCEKGHFCYNSDRNKIFFTKY